MIYEAALRQIERMRAMQYAYHQKFFSWLILTLVLLLLFILLPGGRGWLIVPFLVVTAGVQASFYLHFCDFARTHARILEEKMNGWLGTRVLLGGAIEQQYFYEAEKPKISGLLPATPTRFFSVFTFHWMILWGILLLVGWQVAWRGLEPRLAWIYTGILLVWAALNFGFIAWYFLTARDEKRIAEFLREELFKPVDEA
jgi:hypothetical protein